MQTAINLTHILRDLSAQRATGRLLVKLPGALATIYLSLGNIVHATFGVNKGPSALSMILLAEPQSSEFRANLTTPETTIQGSLESLLASPVPTPRTPATTPGTPTTSAPSTPAPANRTPATTSNEVVPAGFMSELSTILIEVMGPIGSIVLDDALTDLNLTSDVPKQSLPTLLDELNKQLKFPSRQGPFTQKSNALLARYGLR